MTEFSLRILERPRGATRPTLERYDLEATTLQDISLQARDCGPYGLSAWAETRKIKLYYVDNCWVRAAVRGSDLPAFFREVLGSEAELGPDIQPDGCYLIEAEEY